MSRAIVEQLEAVADEAVSQGAWFEVTVCAFNFSKFLLANASELCRRR